MNSNLQNIKSLLMSTHIPFIVVVVADPDQIMSVSIIKLWLIVNLAVPVSVCAPNKILSQQYHSHHNVKCNQVWVWSVDHQWNLSSKTWSKYLWNFPHFISSPTFISDDRIQSWNASHFSIQMECQSSGDITSSYWFFTMIGTCFSSYFENSLTS